MLKQGLQQKQQQKLSPLQIQTIKLLELPTLELEQKIRKEIEENPVLDEIAESSDPEDDSPQPEAYPKTLQVLSQTKFPQGESPKVPDHG